jgi:hypothetical protein
MQKLTKKELVGIISHSPLKVKVIVLQPANVAKMAEEILNKVYGKGNWDEQ